MTIQSKPFLELVAACDNFPYNEEGVKSRIYRLHLPNDPNPHGYIFDNVVQRMPWTDSFKVSHEHKTVSITGNPSDAFTQLITKCIDEKAFPGLDRHTEYFAVLGAREPVKLSRFATPYFGITTRGAHLTAYTRDQTTGELKIWVPRRSAHLFSYPGMLDTTVAGGVSADEDPFTNIVREGQEEASLPEHLTSQAKAVGVLTYMGLMTRSKYDVVAPDVLYVFDLELPSHVVPKPCDDEVEAFYLMDVERVKTAMLKKEFKPNSALVMIDFFIRHGILREDNMPDYTDIMARMHRTLPFPIAPPQTGAA